MLAVEKMNPEYYQQAQRLQDLRTAQLGRQQGAAYDYSSSGGYVAQNGNGDVGGREMQMGENQQQPLRDPLIFPGVYAPSGFDIMDILVSVHTRANPTIPLGSIDHSVALTLCDPDAPDLPIVYCSEQFEILTGYTSSQILGQNCRFLQSPPQTLPSPNNQNQSQNQFPYPQTQMDPKDMKANENARYELKEKMGRGEDARVSLVNFKRDGRGFLNILTVIPVCLNGKRYFVGFQADAGKAFI